MFRTIFLIICLFLNSPGLAQESKENQIEQLQKKVSELEAKISELHGEKQDTSSVDAQLEKELAKELGMEKPSASEAKEEQESNGISQETLTARQRIFQNMNPNVSVIGTVLGSGSSQEELDRNIDLLFQEGEFAFEAAVDPFAKANFYIAFGRHSDPVVHPEGEAHEEEEGHEEGLTPEIEEAYITILSLPFSTQLKAGKFRSKFGKINETHPHAYNFIGVPLMYRNFFGAEGLNDEGASLSWLLPNPTFFQELTFQVTAGPGENASFSRAETNRLLYLAHLKSFFDLNENTTLELGVTGLTGPHNADGDDTHILAADLTIKWKPLQRNRYKSFEFMSEFLISQRNATGGDVTSLGGYGFLRYQFAKRWFLGSLFDYSEYPEFSESNHKAYSGILQFFATEFQKVELQYKYNDGNFFDSFSEVLLRAVFVIGAHGAHQY